MYLTLDSIDGKQARRSKSSSPLGQLLDHGGDSIAVVFIILTVCYAVKAPPLQILLGATSIQAMILIVNWIEYNKGIFHTQVAQFGLT
jgi:ethanolaminephosphotransferase